jgi:hypothetical protein
MTSEWDERYKNIANGTNKSGGGLTTDRFVKKEKSRRRVG